MAPGSSLQAAIDAYPEGTTFCLRAGAHRLTAPVVVKSSDRILGEPGAVVNGSRLLTSFTQDGPYWVAGGQTQQAQPNGTCDGTYTGCQYPEGVYLDNQSLWQVTSRAELAPGRFYFDYANDRIYLADNPANRTVEASVAPGAFLGHGVYQRNVTVQGLVIEKFANSSLAAVHTGEAWAVDFNEIRLNHGRGVFANTGAVLRRNAIHHNGQYGLTSSASGVLIEANTIAYNNTDGFNPNWDAGGTKFLNTTGLVVRNNHVFSNTGPGLATDGNNRGTVYEGNIIWNNTGAGIIHEISYDAVIRNNRLENNATRTAGRSVWWGADIMVNSSSDVDIVGNVIRSRNNAVGLVDVAGRGAGALGTYETRNAFVHGNDITLFSGSIGLVGSSDATYSKNNRFDYNTYRLPDPAGRYFEWRNTYLLTASEWQGHGQELNGWFTTL